MALAATAAAAARAEGAQTNTVTSEKEGNSVKGSPPQSNGGKSKIFEKGGKGNTSGSVWSWKMGPVLHATWSTVKLEHVILLL
jgi:hypothetical protein